MLSNLYLSVKSVKMDILQKKYHKWTLYFLKAGEWVTRRDPPR